MRDYFFGLILFAFFGSVILSVAPHGLSRTYLRFLCGLCSVGCIIFPLVSLVSPDGDGGADIEAFFETEDGQEKNAVEIYNLYLDGVAEKNAEETLKSEIITELRAKSEDIDVDIILDKSSDEIYIKSVYVFFYPSGYDIDPKKVEKICFSALGCGCEFFYK